MKLLRAFLLLLTCAILSFSMLSVFAAEPLCDYTISREVTEEVSGVVVKDTNQFIAKPAINFEDVIGLELPALKIKITNPNNIALRVKFNFDYEVSGDEFCTEMGGKTLSEVLDLGAGESKFFEKSLGTGCKVVVFDPLSINYSFVENSVVFGEEKQVSTSNVPMCKVCDGGKACFNDGDVCLKSSECGSNYCFDGVCQKSPKCLDGICTCNNSLEVECDGGRICAKKDVLDFGTRPICSSLECKSHFVDQKTGLCAKIPDSNIISGANSNAGSNFWVEGNWFGFSFFSNLVIVIIAIVLTAFAISYFTRRKWVKQARELKLHYKKENELLEFKSDLKIKELEFKEKEELAEVGLASKTDVKNAAANLKRSEKKLEELKKEVEGEEWTEKIL
jgi:hypothetical protein